MRDHISLTNQIRRDIGGNLAPTVTVLRWLDDHPDQVPGRTITESDYSDIAEWARNFFSRGWEGRTVLAGAGITIVPDPDPEPMNAEKLRELLEMAQKDNAAQSYTRFAEYLDRMGVKAPGAGES